MFNVRSKLDNFEFPIGLPMLTPKVILMLPHYIEATACPISSPKFTSILHAPIAKNAGWRSGR
jgi:hypothetical protein